MTITTGRSDLRRGPRRNCKGFSLVELMIASGISSMILAAALSAVIFISRASLATSDYAGMDGEARQGLETFGRDVRMAENVSDFSANSVTLHVPTSSGSETVNYTYMPAIGAFYRAHGTPAQKLLIKGVESFELKRFTLQQTPATNDLETKQLQLELRAVRKGPVQAFASNNVISARYILRNKIVSN